MLIPRLCDGGAISSESPPQTMLQQSLESRASKRNSLANYLFCKMYQCSELTAHCSTRMHIEDEYQWMHVSYACVPSGSFYCMFICLRTALGSTPCLGSSVETIGDTTSIRTRVRLAMSGFMLDPRLCWHASASTGGSWGGDCCRLTGWRLALSLHVTAGNRQNPSKST